MLISEMQMFDNEIWQWIARCITVLNCQLKWWSLTTHEYVKCNEWSIYVNLVHEHAYFVLTSEMILVRN